jgi:hypothetical protein
MGARLSWPHGSDRKRIEEAFGWIKTITGQEKTKFRGRARRMVLHLRRESDFAILKDCASSRLSRCKKSGTKWLIPGHEKWGAFFCGF